MANHYLQFSEVLPQLTEEEERWLRHQLEFVLVFGDTEYAKADVPDNLDSADAEWEGCRGFRDMDSYEPDFGEDVGFGYSFADDLHGSWGRHLWLYAEEGGCVDRVAHLVQKFLREFRPDQCWSLTYATTCSKPRVGEFSGGALFVTAADIKWHNACEVIEQERAAFSEPKDEHKPQGVFNMSDGPVQDERELATVLAALRFWQRHEPSQPNRFFDRLSIDERDALDAIRTGCGTFTDLDAAEIDRLCERINGAPGGVVSATLNVPPVVAAESRPFEVGETPCDCELPGYFYSGVPGILARVENGRLVPGAKVERCDSCQRYTSDEAAYEKLAEMGID